MFSKVSGFSLTNLSLKQRLKELLFSSHGFALFICYTTLAILFVLFQMKNVETDYKITDTKEKINVVSIQNKQLRAKKAKLLSSKRLQFLAKKYDLKQPSQRQIILIP